MMYAMEMVSGGNGMHMIFHEDKSGIQVTLRVMPQ